MNWENALAWAYRLAAGAIDRRGERRPWSSNPLARTCAALTLFPLARRWLASAAATKGRTVISCLAHRALDACWLLGARDRRETPRLWRWAKGYAPVPASRVVDGSRKTWPASTKLIEPYGKHTEDSLGNGLNELEFRKCRVSQSPPSALAPPAPPASRRQKNKALENVCQTFLKERRISSGPGLSFSRFGDMARNRKIYNRPVSILSLPPRAPVTRASCKQLQSPFYPKVFCELLIVKTAR